jgi:hypothetical protein
MNPFDMLQKLIFSCETSAPFGFYHTTLELMAYDQVANRNLGFVTNETLRCAQY